MPTGNWCQFQWSATDWHLILINTSASGFEWRRTAQRSTSTSQCQADSWSCQQIEDSELWDLQLHLLLACKACINILTQNRCRKRASHFNVYCCCLKCWLINIEYIKLLKSKIVVDLITILSANFTSASKSGDFTNNDIYK